MFQVQLKRVATNKLKSQRCNADKSDKKVMALVDLSCRKICHDNFFDKILAADKSGFIAFAILHRCFWRESENSINRQARALMKLLKFKNDFDKRN